MQTLDVCKKDGGKLWHRKPLPSDDGCLLTITNDVSGVLSSYTRNVRFLHAVFDSSGDSFVAGDYQGHLYLFDITRNRFSLVQKSGSACTALAFSMRRRTEFLVAHSDYSLKCYDTVSKEQVAAMKGHESSVTHISIHASGRYALTSSADEGHLWDLDTFQRKRKLNIKENVGIVRVFFLPLSNTIMTCFKDDSVFAWEADTLQCKYQLNVPEGKNPYFKAFACSRDGRLLVGGGRSRFLHLWTLDTRKLLRIIELPKKVTSVKQLEFLADAFDAGTNVVLGVLSQDGIMRYINIDTCKLLFDIGALENRINNVTVSPTGRHIVAVMECGNICVYDVRALCSEVNKPPPPLVKVLKANKMANQTDDSAMEKKQSKSKEAKGKESKALPQESLNSTQELPEGLSMSRLQNILKQYGEYPTKYRMFIWRSVLRLPENHAAYGALVDKGTHPAFDRVHEQYPMKSAKLLRVLQRVLSALAHWSPIFGETDYLPMLAFPFVKLFQNNQLVCFEILASILTNWCQHWFEYFPNPPINILGLVENSLAFYDKDLLAHFMSHGITTQLYAWPLLATLFSEVLTSAEWLRLFDNVFSNKPAFLIMCVVAYNSVNRGPLMKCVEEDDFKYFYHHRNAVDVNQVIKEAYRLMDVVPEEVNPTGILEEFVPLTKGQYPVFNKYPKFIVDYQVQERERIRSEEIDYLRQRQASLELQQETQLRQHEEEAWYRQQKLLQDAEQRRRKLISEEEQKLADQRTRLGAMNRELKMKELQLMDATRRKFLEYQQQQKEMELARMDDEIRRKAELRESETADAMQDAEVRNMELQLQRKMFEQELQREFEETRQKTRSDYEARRHRQDMEHRASRTLTENEWRKDVQARRAASKSLTRTEQAEHDAGIRHEAELKQHMDDLETERKHSRLPSSESKVARLTQENRRLEEKVQELIRKTEEKKADIARDRYEDVYVQQNVADSTQLRRLQDLEQEVEEARRHVQDIELNQSDALERLRHLREGSRAQLPPVSYGNTDTGCLNETTETESSTAFSLDRGRGAFEEGERQLMSEVRRLRAKLATESRQRKPPPVSATGTAEII